MVTGVWNVKRLTNTEEGHIESVKEQGGENVCQQGQGKKECKRSPTPSHNTEALNEASFMGIHY